MKWRQAEAAASEAEREQYLREAAVLGRRLNRERDFSMVMAERKFAQSVRDRAEALVSVEDRTAKAFLLTPEIVSPGHFGGTHGKEREHLENFLSRSLPRGEEAHATIYSRDDMDAVVRHARDFLETVRYCGVVQCD